MITLIFVLSAMVLLTAWDAAAAEDNAQPIAICADDVNTNR